MKLFVFSIMAKVILLNRNGGLLRRRTAMVVGIVVPLEKAA